MKNSNVGKVYTFLAFGFENRRTEKER